MTDTTGIGMSGVTMVLSSDRDDFISISTMTNNGGNYLFYNVMESTNTYAITPSKSGCFFEPVYRSTTSLSGPLYGQNFSVVGGSPAPWPEPGKIQVVISSTVVSSIHISQTASIQFTGFSSGVHGLRIYNPSGIIICKQDSIPISQGSFTWSPSGYTLANII